jgi:mono/diheme cytochrome c family protein
MIFAEFKRGSVVLAIACLVACSSQRSAEKTRTTAAPRNASHKTLPGASIYKTECAKCHGKNGEGIKGKYDDALVGDWSLEKLTRYISKNMPDDDPGTLSGADAETVARYINDAFYSREARARNHPARVELVRLTNRQYVNTVADLLKSFSEADAPLGNERGLRGSYRKGGRRFGGANNFERVDAKVDFDFGPRHPFGPVTHDSVNKTTNEFSISWRGSVIVDESGDYEFIVKTPNGSRLWVNDDDTPLIDASVVSGKVDDYRATRRLIGGRVYPLRLECNKAAKDQTSAMALMWKPPHGVEQIIPARNLAPARVSPTFVITTPFPADDSSVGYERGVMVSKAWDEATTYAAIEAANYVAKDLDRLSGSKAGDTNRAAKVQAFCAEFVSAAFRRPLTDEQKRVYVAAHFQDALKLDDVAKRVVLLALKSPRFLYLGLDNNQPDDLEVAARLSFDLWDSLPDAELRKAAVNHALHTPEQVSEQARRMLADPRARAKMLSFLHHWLQLSRAEDLSKDAKLFPGFTPEIIADLRTSLNLFLDEVVWSPSSDYRRLLMEDDLWVNDRLAKFYGVGTNGTDDFVKVNLNPKERCGVITHPYLLAMFSYPRSTSPIHRGVFLTRNIVGRALKPPPIAVAFKEADFAPNLTMREKISELTRPQACQGCHSAINPLGFSLEHYDAVGRFRTKDGDKLVDAVSDYIADDGTSVRLTGARDVAEFAVNGEHAQNAFIEQLFHSIVKQPLLAYGSAVQERLRKSFVASGFNIQKLLVDIATVSSLHGVETAAVARKSAVMSETGAAALSRDAATEGKGKL